MHSFQSVGLQAFSSLCLTVIVTVLGVCLVLLMTDNICVSGLQVLYPLAEMLEKLPEGLASLAS